MDTAVQLQRDLEAFWAAYGESPMDAPEGVEAGLAQRLQDRLNVEKQESMQLAGGKSVSVDTVSLELIFQ